MATLLDGARENLAEWEEVAENLAETLARLRAMGKERRPRDAWNGRSHSRDYYRNPFRPPWTGQSGNPQGYGEAGSDPTRRRGGGG